MNAIHTLKRTASGPLALACVLAVSQLGLMTSAAQSTGGAGGGGGGGGAGGGGSAGAKGGVTKHTAIVIKGIEPVHEADAAARKELPWLGVSAEEAAEVVTAQLGLDPGVGLVVAYVAKDSPAAKAGLQKNDVLVEFAGQSLVHPAQLRKLVQTRKEGDRVELVFYRAGKKQTTTATLGKTTPGFGLLDDEHAWHGDWRELQRQFRDLPIGDAIREQMKALRESLGDVRIDREKVQEDIRRGMTEARKAWQQAMQQLTNSGAALGPAARALRDLQHDLELDNKTTVTVRSTGKSVKSIVKSDDTGTLVILQNPRLRLTAHDKDGKLLFDGEIETPEQRGKVPPEVWEQVEPLLQKMKSDAKEEDREAAESDDAAAGSPAVGSDEDFTRNISLLLDARLL